MPERFCSLALTILIGGSIVKSSRHEKLCLIRYDLCVGILDSPTYPWQPQATEAETFFSFVEEEFACSQAWNEQELQENSVYFFDLLEDCWPRNRAARLLQNLKEKFSSLLPLKELEQIVCQIDSSESDNRGLNSEILVECARSLLPDWLEADLEIKVNVDKSFKKLSLLSSP